MAPAVENEIQQQEQAKKITTPIELTFYKEGSTWLAYNKELWEGGMKYSCTMVAGTDEVLNMLAEGNTKLTLLISQTYIRDYRIYLVSADEGEFEGETGGDYLVSGYINENRTLGTFGAYRVWLCQVTKYIFGFYPQVMFVKVIDLKP